MINIVTALHCEARPLIARYGLQSVARDGGIHLYEGAHMRLIVTGVGPLACASGTAYLHAWFHDGRDAAWLNLGIAGHAREPLGSGFLADKVIDQSSGQCWYPSIAGAASARSATVISVVQPTADYPDDALYDMEAAGFMSGASQFSSAELIRCFKIVSDNLSNPGSKVSHQSVLKLVQDGLDEIDSIVTALRDVHRLLHETRRPPDEFGDYLIRWHFSEYQRNQLLRLLQRWSALQPEGALWCEEFETLSNSRQLLSALRCHVDSLPARLSRRTGGAGG